MPTRLFDVIAFDADDTLWHNERSYRDGRERFRRILARAGVDLDAAEIEARVTRTEVANIRYFGYGVSSFALSLIETAIEASAGRIAAGDLHALIELARGMLTEEIELFDGVADTLAALSGAYPLMLVTKGDLLHQTSKLERSGLKEHFSFVEVVSHKTPEVYAGILGRHGIDAQRFLMVGNSLRSDVLPVVDAGGWAVHVPAELSWSHEHADVPEDARRRYFELPAIGALPRFIEELSASAVAASAGKNDSTASSDSVMSTGVPKMVVVLKKDSTPPGVAS
jgi:putative hydrolase of the HAD superfamily